MKTTKKANGKKVRTVAFLTREELDFVDKLSKDARFSTGHKLSYSDILRALINAFKNTNIDSKGVKSSKELEQRLTEMIKGKGIKIF